MGEAQNIRSSSHSKRWAQFRLDREQREFQTKKTSGSQGVETEAAEMCSREEKHWTFLEHLPCDRN